MFEASANEAKKLNLYLQQFKSLYIQEIKTHKELVNQNDKILSLSNSIKNIKLDNELFKLHSELQELQHEHNQLCQQIKFKRLEEQFNKFIEKKEYINAISIISNHPEQSTMRNLLEQSLFLNIQSLLKKLKWPEPILMTLNKNNPNIDNLINCIQLLFQLNDKLLEKALMEGIKIRFIHYFHTDNPINQPDKPEYVFYYIERMIDQHAPFIVEMIESEDEEDGDEYKDIINKDYDNPDNKIQNIQDQIKNNIFDLFVNGLIKLGKLKFEELPLEGNIFLIRHTMNQVGKFQSQLIKKYNFHPIDSIIDIDDDILKWWYESEMTMAMESYSNITASNSWSLSSFPPLIASDFVLLVQSVLELGIPLSPFQKIIFNEGIYCNLMETFIKKIDYDIDSPFSNSTDQLEYLVSISNGVEYLAKTIQHEWLLNLDYQSYWKNMKEHQNETREIQKHIINLITTILWNRFKENIAYSRMMKHDDELEYRHLEKALLKLFKDFHSLKEWTSLDMIKRNIIDLFNNFYSDGKYRLNSEFIITPLIPISIKEDENDIQNSDDENY